MNQEISIQSEESDRTVLDEYYCSSLPDSMVRDEFVRRFTLKSGQLIRSANEAANHFQGFYSDAAKKEKFVVCFLDSQHQILSTEVMFVGSISTSAVYPREIIERVLDLGASSVMISHNHPSGAITPSSSDRALTKKLQTALSAIDVDLLDHLIVGGLEHFSFSDHHLL
jgi:DNA repair protein RadC